MVVTAINPIVIVGINQLGYLGGPTLFAIHVEGYWGPARAIARCRGAISCFQTQAAVIGMAMTTCGDVSKHVRTCQTTCSTIL